MLRVRFASFLLHPSSDQIKRAMHIQHQIQIQIWIQIHIQIQIQSQLQIQIHTITDRITGTDTNATNEICILSLEPK